MKNPPCFASNVEHKQSKAPPSRMPALSGMLAILDELPAILRKLFSQGRRINRIIGAPYLRPPVSSLSALVAAILLYASDNADAQSQAPPMIGIMYLENADSLGDPLHDWCGGRGRLAAFVRG